MEYIRKCLMNQFHNTLLSGERKKRQVHFHLYVGRLTRTQTNSEPYDPLPSIALDFANESAVLCLDEFQVTDVAGVMILRRLLKMLFDYGVVLVATSNSPPDDHYKR